MGSQPTPPAPDAGLGAATEVGNQQQAFNTQTANQQQGINTGIANQQQGFNVGSQAGSQYNQFNPYGGLSYTQTGTGPNGVPIYTANESYSPTEQNLFNQYTGSQATAGQQANSLLSGANYGATSPTDTIGGMTSGITNQLLNSEVSSLQPYFNIQTNNEQNQLANQGITPTGNPTAYNNAMMPLYGSQQSTVSNFLANAEPQAFTQASSLYQMPLTMGQQLAQWGAPQSPSGMETSNTPALAGTNINPTTVQPTNLIQAYGTSQQAAEQQYQAQQAQYNAMMNGLFSLGGDVLGGMAMGGGL